MFRDKSMASSKEFSFEGSFSGYGDDDIRGDSKKRKFKALSAVKKFFTKKRDKKDTVVAVKAKSTTALHSSSRTDDDDDDDDGGFRSHSKPLALAGSRSLSEDSVFSPEQRSATIAAFPKAAVSEESLPKSAFQSELLSKLNKRQSQYSDDYHDDGLPRSPVPPITTADVIMGGPLKREAGPSGKSSSNRDSDQSLISVDSSENEEEEFSLSKWKSSVSGSKLVATSCAASRSTMDTLDFNSIQKTELLVSRAAKDKIMVKPHRKTSRQSRMRRETSSPLSSLPSLNEESPTKTNHGVVKESWVAGSSVSQETVSVLDEKSSMSSASISYASLSADIKSGPVIRTTSKSSLSSVAVSSKRPLSSGSPVTSPTTLSPPAVVLPTTTASVTDLPTKVATPTSPSVVFPLPKVASPTSPSINFPLPKADVISSPTDQSLSTSSPNASTTTVLPENTASPDIVSKKTEKLSSSERGDKMNLTDISVTQLSQSQRELNENKPNLGVKSRMSQFEKPALDTDVKRVNSYTPASILPLHAEDPDNLPLDSLLLASTTDNYKPRNQLRSKTLPAVINEQISPKVQRSSSHRIPSSGFPEPQESFESTILTLSSPSITEAGSINTKRSENVKFSDSTVTPTGEPSWMVIVRKKNADQEINFESDKTKTTEAAVSKTGLSTSAPKSVFTSASSYLEKKRGSVETISYKNREFADLATKNIDSHDASKPQSVDINSKNKHSNVDFSSTKKEESTEISHKGSVKASRNIFDASSRSNSQKDSVHSSTSAVLATSERIKQFSSSASGTTISSSVLVKPGSNVGHEQASTTPGGAAPAANAKVASGITHMRGGSVKTLPAKTVELKSALKSRSGSIKGSTSIIATTEPNLLLEPVSQFSNKAEPASVIKPDSLEPFTASAPQSSPHVSMPVAAQPNNSLPTQTPSAVTISTEKVASAEKVASIETASIVKVASIEKEASDKTAADVKKPVTPGKVPAWRTHLSKEVKIEIIENSPSAPPASSTLTTPDILRQGHKGKPFETPKNTESSLAVGAAVDSEKTRRSSKVLDLVKNFQNLQA